MNSIHLSNLASTVPAGLLSAGIEEAMRVWEHVGREEVEEYVQKIEDIEWSSKLNQDGGDLKYIAG